MQCPQCPLTMPCYAGRLYEGHTQGMLCPHCLRFTHVQFRVYEATTPTPKGPITIHVDGFMLRDSMRAKDQLEQYHRVFHCPERVLNSVQLVYWGKNQEREPRYIYSLCDPHPQYNDDDVRLNVVPCIVCEPQRYGKAAYVEKLD